MKERTLQLRMATKAVMIGLLLGVAGKAYAYDFSAVCETGQTLYYNIIDAENHYVELTYPGNNEAYPWTSFISPSGNITLPSLVYADNQVYEVTAIGNYAFSTCNNLTGNLIIPSTVNTIGNWAFNKCSSFNGTLFVPNNVTTIGTGAFSNCYGFTGDLIIPNSVTTIKSNAFEQCYGFNGYLSISNSISSIATGAFFNCYGFTGTLDLPNSVKWIFDSAFSGCSGFTGSLIIPNSVYQIGEEAFSNCSGFDDALIIGSSVRTIGYHTFVGCSNFSSLICFASAPPTIEWNAFHRFPTSIPIYVPYGTKATYRIASGWNEFTNYQEIAYTTIPAHGENDGWHFIASPLAASTAPTEIDNMLPTAGTFDFYRFDQSETAEWQNYKATSFNLANGQGYLYANQEDVDLIFKGSFNEGTSQEVGLTYDGTAQFAGWNLVGNPFPYSATVSRSYYVMNEDGTAIEPTPLSSGSTIAACTGIMVKADGANESVTFSKATRQVLEKKGLMHIALSQVVERPLNLSKGGVSSGSTTAAIDKAIVSFNACDALEKFVFNTGNAQISIPQGGKDYAIATVGRDAARHVSTEMPINFKASKNGTYTISVSLDNVELDYLHLIDNMTGADVDLLSAGDRGSVPTMTTEGVSYTFTAKTTDYASRFRLVFSGQADGPSADEQLFAYISNGNIVINEADALGASLQVVDMTGRIVLSTGGHTQCVPTTGIPSGVYVLRLFNGDEVKTQKIVID